ncbi:hypothetical protein KV557_17755 [Kitasatospora aureofaciens]|uniref:DUF6188 family protein n=1 Tax=Kitasatospora aureofaciens TaxID=1894 RepID=UPI001C46E03D|nr:DUF6188 family protein [Kitasatospora aureofaciens]MBV6698939.1 hypothetical protein [Kitasatospora aureofaciens]
MQNGITHGITEVLAGRRVESVSGGGRLDLTLDGPVTVRVAHEFRFAAPSFAAPAEVEHFFPALTFRPTATLLALVGRTVDSARVTLAGGLELGFAGGGALSVPPHAQLAPWSVVTADGAVCAGLPGGEVSWRGPGGD